MKKWKKMLSIRENIRCPKCHSESISDNYDYEQDLCYSCLYPEMSKSRPAPFEYSTGNAKNRTEEGQLLDNLPYLKEKQSKAATEKKAVFDTMKKVKKVVKKKKKVKKKVKKTQKSKAL